MNQLESAAKPSGDLRWSLWASQVITVLRVELKKSLWMRRSIWIYFLALGPAVVVGLHALLDRGSNISIEEDTTVFAGIFQVYYLRLGIFFSCMGLFTWLIRGEIVEKSLHYYFLAPMRRELLIIGKFLAGLLATAFIFSVGVFLSFVLLYTRFGAAGRAFVFDGPGLGQLLAYLSVTLLACLGYGSLFLALSVVIRNPILPGIVVLLWETFHAILPPLVQKLSVMFYLKQLSPVSIPPEGVLALFTVTAEPVPAWIAVPGLLCLCTAILIFACRKIRRTEISYLAD
jgi:ABC-type transport system involved in multi-copper enzyme maturation permease subunit